VTHIVQPGENLYRIGLQYGYSWVVLAQYNGIPNPNYVVVGQAIRIPPAGAGSGGQPVPPDSGYTYYVVQPGDNLFRIGLKYGMSWVWIAEANGITNPHYIVPGQVLKIPVYPVS
jgi:lysozyme